MRQKALCFLLPILALVCLSSTAHSQELSLDNLTDNLGIEDLLGVKVSVASKKETSLRTSAGIISVITDEDIKNMGARDLIDVLNTVPGISFAVDNEGVVGVGFRGLWAYTGQFLLMIDGIEINEIQYASTQFGNEFPVDQIKRIEIIRGPGSALYGGFAQLIVVNLVTKKGADIKGAASELTLGRMEEGSPRTNLSVSTGIKAKNGWDYSFGAYVGRANRGEGNYTGYSPNLSAGPAAGTFDYKDADKISPTYANLGISNENLNFRFIYDNYDVTTRSYYDFTNVNYNFLNRFRSWDYMLSYDFHPTDKIKITPQVTYYKQNPWQTTEGPLLVAGISKWEMVSERIKSKLTAQYDVSPDMNIQTGAEYISDFTQSIYNGDIVTGANQPFLDGSTKLSYDDRAVFFQGIFNTEKYNFTLGLRYENPNSTSDSFVPRFAVTRAEADWHAKALYAEAFRTPAVMAYNYAIGGHIDSEKSETEEIEYGHKVGAGYLTANIFNILIRHPIVYTTTGNSNDYFTNYLKNGTRGFELDFRQNQKWAQTQINYSYYEKNESDVPAYTIPTNDNAMLGLPQHKIVVSSTFHLSDHTHLNPSLIYMGRKYGYEYNPNLSGMELKSLNDTLLANVFWSHDKLFFKGVSGGIGVFNIFNQENKFAQPYAGTTDSHSPVPGPTRELLVKIDYRKEF